MSALLLLMAHQDGLDLLRSGSGLVHEDLLGNVFPPFHSVQLVVRVTVQCWPPQKLSKSLKKKSFFCCCKSCICYYYTVIHKDKAWYETRFTSVICSSFSSNGLPSFLLKKVATPTISSFLLTMGSESTFLIFQPVSSTASFWKTTRQEMRWVYRQNKMIHGQWDVMGKGIWLYVAICDTLRKAEHRKAAV